MDDTTATPPGALRIDPSHRDVLDQVLDKWSVSILDQLCERPCRFNVLRREIPGITQKSLTATLRRLERNGIVERRVVADRPVAVEYRISDLGKTLREPVDVVLAWVTTHQARIDRARREFDDATEAAGA
ncbi:helix-turn-helix domain-containing protein [Isoptericola halotolerans]|uniref:DNA-binding HxlR family transcriptional regulator n=1 Tax=Isoptericola halotolerans TaxID=300560 RepID=A0ABX2A9Q3_9MICO|nr:DNA-binding HxlR family transcriptional regulator [Isoptericola halotolerans]